MFRPGVTAGDTGSLLLFVVDSSFMKTIEPDHRCHPAFSDQTTQDFPVRWIRADSLSAAGLLGRNAKKVWFGVCGFSHHVIRPAELGVVELVVVNDLFITKGECEMSRRCMAQACPLNKTPDSTIKKMLRIRTKDGMEAVKIFAQRRYCEVFRKRPREGGMMLPRTGLTHDVRRPQLVE